MPRISTFYGIVIPMYVNDHLPPHFHAIYGEFEARFEIASGERMDSAFTPAVWSRIGQSFTGPS